MVSVNIYFGWMIIEDNARQIVHTNIESLFPIWCSVGRGVWRRKIVNSTGRVPSLCLLQQLFYLVILLRRDALVLSCCTSPSAADIGICTLPASNTATLDERLS